MCCPIMAKVSDQATRWCDVARAVKGTFAAYLALKDQASATNDCSVSPQDSEIGSLESMVN